MLKIENPNIKKIVTLAIFVGVAQFMTYIALLFIELPNLHITALIGSLVGFIFGYKGDSKEID